MTEQKNPVKRAITGVVQKMLREEALGWPPDCLGIHYQPRRPDRPLADSAPDKEEN